MHYWRWIAQTYLVLIQAQLVDLITLHLFSYKFHLALFFYRQRNIQILWDIGRAINFYDFITQNLLWSKRGKCEKTFQQLRKSTYISDLVRSCFIAFVLPQNLRILIKKFLCHRDLKFSGFRFLTCNLYNMKSTSLFQWIWAEIL